nr:MAG TPA: hypothetical protein [Caudoviricetes sp.]
MHPARPATPLTYATGIPACCWSAAYPSSACRRWRAIHWPAFPGC